MYKLTFVALCIILLGAAEARMPADIGKMLGLVEEETEESQPLVSLLLVRFTLFESPSVRFFTGANCTSVRQALSTEASKLNCNIRSVEMTHLTVYSPFYFSLVLDIFLQM